jgi:hypothetical protein
MSHVEGEKSVASDGIPRYLETGAWKLAVLTGPAADRLTLSGRRPGRTPTPVNGARHDECTRSGHKHRWPRIPFLHSLGLRSHPSLAATWRGPDLGPRPPQQGDQQERGRPHPPGMRNHRQVGNRGEQEQ